MLGFRKNSTRRKGARHSAYPRFRALVRVEELEPRALLSAMSIGGLTNPPATSLSPFAGGNAGSPASSGLLPAAIQPGGGTAQTASSNGNVTPVNAGVPGNQPGGNSNALLTSAVLSNPAALNGSPLSAVLGQSATTAPPLTGPLTYGAAVAGVRPAVEQGQEIALRTDTISLTRLAVPGSSAAPQAEAPPVPFAYITGPYVAAPGPANAMPTFAVDTARVNAGVGGGMQGQSGGVPSQGAQTAVPQVPAASPVRPAATATQTPVQNLPAELRSKHLIASPALPKVTPAWAEVSAAYFAEKEAAFPLSVEEVAGSPDAPAIAGMVAVLGGAIWWQPEGSFRETQAKRRRPLRDWATPI